MTEMKLHNTEVKNRDYTKELFWRYEKITDQCIAEGHYELALQALESIDILLSEGRIS